eukprot:515732_1
MYMFTMLILWIQNNHGLQSPTFLFQIKQDSISTHTLSLNATTPYSIAITYDPSVFSVNPHYLDNSFTDRAIFNVFNHNVNTESDLPSDNHCKTGSNPRKLTEDYSPFVPFTVRGIQPTATLNAIDFIASDLYRMQSTLVCHWQTNTSVDLGYGREWSFAVHTHHIVSQDQKNDSYLSMSHAVYRSLPLRMEYPFWLSAFPVFCGFIALLFIRHIGRISDALSTRHFLYCVWFCLTMRTSASDFSYCLTNDVIEGWYDGDSIDIANSLWIDKSSSQNDATINNNVGLGVFNGNQTTHELFTDFNTTAVYGATTTQITFNVALHPTNHTVFNYCKYRDVGTKRRILQGSLENSLFGFWNGRSGVGYIHPVWISDSSNHFGTEWVLSAQQRDLYRGNRIDFTVGTGTFAQTNQLMINLGAYPADTSDWACTEIIVLNQKIPLHEIQCIENYLVEKYSTNAPTTAPTQQTPSPTRHLASESFKYEFGFITA